MNQVKKNKYFAKISISVERRVHRLNLYNHK